MARVTRMTKRRLGELLQAEGLINEDQLKAGLEEQRKSNMFLGEALVKLGFVSEEAIAHTIVTQFNLPFMSAMQCNISVDVLNIFAERMYYEYQFIAVERIGKTLLIVGAGLMNHDVLDELERLCGGKVCQYVSTWKDIKSALDKYAKEMKKGGQQDLSSLGSMLLDSKLTPMPTPRPPGPEAAAPTAPASAPVLQPVLAKPAPSVAPAVLKPAAAATAPAPAAQAPGTVAPGQPQPTASVRPGALASSSQRMSALTAPKSSASSQNLPKVAANASGHVAGPKAPTATPNAAPGAIPTPAKPNDAAPAPKAGQGLLGLFKKS